MNGKTRPLNDLDRAHLENIRKQAEKVRLSLTELFLSNILVYCLAGQVVSLVWVAVARLSGLLPRMNDWQDVPIVFNIVVVIFGVIAVQFIWMLVAGRRVRHPALEKVSVELAHDEVEETIVTVEEVKCFQEPEHLMEIYLLRTSDGRIWVWYDFDSAPAESRGEPDRGEFPLSREMTIVHFKHLDHVRCEFGSTKIQRPPAQSLNAPPDDWPEDETWLDIPWEDLDRRYSG